MCTTSILITLVSEQEILVEHYYLVLV